jgi:geranylgeranyl reductase family protein
MASCDVLIVGGGPAGSSCAWALRRAGVDAGILDRKSFPRDKVCGGWITPAVVEELEIDLAEYGSSRVLQPITGFRTSRMGGAEVLTDYGTPISYGIRRFEFDEFLMRRSGARLFESTPFRSLERLGDGWLVNGEIKARLIVGAGGHFCPVARWLGANARDEVAVAAQELEFEMTPGQQDACTIRGEIPELFFSADVKGYGWCFRKGNFLNVGLGRLDPHGLPQHVAEFVEFLRESRKLGFELPKAMSGHAYLLYRGTTRKMIDDGVMLIGDAMGLAYSQSGEGIRPAVESGLLAARAISAADGHFSQDRLEDYRSLLLERFGNADSEWSAAIGRRLPSSVISSLARGLFASGWFSRHIILDRWLLHRNEPALSF